MKSLITFYSATINRENLQRIGVERLINLITLSDKNQNSFCAVARGTTKTMDLLLTKSVPTCLQILLQSNFMQGIKGDLRMVDRTAKGIFFHMIPKTF